MNKIIVAHPGRQHSYRIASALKKNNMLLKYVTTVYDKDTFLMKLTKIFLSKENLNRANGRKNKDLDDQDVIQYYEFRGLIETLLSRSSKLKFLYNYWQQKTADKFGLKVAKLAIKLNADAVVIYDVNAKECFKYLKQYAPNILRIMDVSAANRLYMKKIYEDDMKICPEFSNKLLQERKILWNEKFCKKINEEIRLTNIFLVPSLFVAKSLEYSGINKDQIKLCPYGTNFSPCFSPKKINDNKIKAIYVGNVTEMKGIYYLLEAALLLKDKMTLTVVGNYDNSEHYFDKYLKSVDFIGRVQHDKVKEYLKESEVFIFPSLGEGLSLSVLEAMSMGLTCIVSENSGANDAIKDYENGFVINIQNIQAIVDKINWLYENKNQINYIGKNAYLTSFSYTWNNYEKRIVEIFNKL